MDATSVRRDWRKNRRSERIERHTTELVADPSVVAAVDAMQSRIDHLEQCVAQIGADMVASINALNAKIEHEIETHKHNLVAKLVGDRIVIASSDEGLAEKLAALARGEDPDRIIIGGRAA